MMFGIIIIGTLAILGADEAGLVDTFIGREYIVQFASDIGDGVHDRLLGFLIIGFSVLLFLVFGFAYAYDALVSAIWRYRTRKRIFLTDKQLVADLEEISRSLLDFAHELRAHGPAGRDTLNYILGDPSGYQIGGDAKNTIYVGSGARDFDVRQARQVVAAQQELLAYYMLKYNKELSGRVGMILHELQARDLLTDEDNTLATREMASIHADIDPNHSEHLARLFNRTAERLKRKRFIQ